MELPFVSRKKYDELVYKLECLLCHATGGKLFKGTYSSPTMQYAVTDYINERCDEAIEYSTRALIEENERLHASYTELTQKCASLIEENEKLTEEIEKLQKALSTDISIVRMCRGSGKTAYLREVGRIKVKAIRDNTVKKMRDRLLEEACKIARVRHADEPNMKSTEVFRLIDQIAKELLEEIDEK